MKLEPTLRKTMSHSKYKRIEELKKVDALRRAIATTEP